MQKVKIDGHLDSIIDQHGLKRNQAALSLRIILNLLDDNRYGPGNRSHWALNKTRFPNLIKALNQEPDMSTRKCVSSLYQAITCRVTISSRRKDLRHQDCSAEPHNLEII